MLVWILTLFIFTSSAFGAAKVSETVAQVGTIVITSREIKALALMDQAMEVSKANETSAKKWDAASEDSEIFKRKLNQAILDCVLSLEAENFSVGQVSQEELSKRKETVQRILKDNVAWKNLEIQEPELQLFLTRKMSAQIFLKYKSDTSAVTVAEDEAKAYFEKNRVKFGNMPYSQFSGSIKSFLAETQLQEKLKDWFDILKRKYKVKMLYSTELPKR